jgi:hypothetical protein
MLLLALLGCAFGHDRRTCRWELDSFQMDASYLGTSPQEVMDHWQGEHNYRAMAPGADYDEIYNTTVLPASWVESWSVLVEQSGPPQLRSVSDCHSNVAIPVNWSIGLSDQTVVAEGAGELSDPDIEGSISIFGPDPEDWVVELRWWDRPIVSVHSSFWAQLGRDPQQQDEPNLTFYGSGALGRLRLSSMSPGNTEETSFLSGIRESAH